MRRAVVLTLLLLLAVSAGGCARDLPETSLEAVIERAERGEIASAMLHEERGEITVEDASGHRAVLEWPASPEDADRLVASLNAGGARVLADPGGGLSPVLWIPVLVVGLGAVAAMGVATLRRRTSAAT